MAGGFKSPLPSSIPMILWLDSWNADRKECGRIELLPVCLPLSNVNAYFLKKIGLKGSFSWSEKGLNLKHVKNVTNQKTVLVM